MTISEAAKIFKLTSLNEVTTGSLKQIYHELAGKYHPDKGGSAKDFIDLRNAYTSLKEAIRLGIKLDNNPKNNSAYQNTPPPQDYSTLYKNFNNLQQQYQELYKIHQKYDNTFNIQIELINNTVNRINSLASTYNTNFSTAKSVLDQGLELLLQQYNRKWWEHIIPVPKLSEAQYITKHNQLIEAYNQQIEEFQTEYNDLLINTYQRVFEQMINRIKEL
jgi:curved DNA-binding protein CbpA